MLSECFIASTLASSKAPASATLRDVGVCVHEFQPTLNLRSTFKKSSTAANCLAVSPSHVFAAQSEKAIVHVYSREKGNQEATVPFPERIRSIAVAGGKNGDVLVLGTEGGRLILWETCTGRQVATTASHLRPVTSLVVDPNSNFILSGSSDASIHVWSLVDLLSFTKPPSGRDRQPPNSPIRTFSNHRAAITAIAVGHSAGRYNIALSAADDSTAIAWDYHTGRLLRTFLLPSNAKSLALDPADRAFYVGYEDGSIQSIDFYKNQSIQNPLHDPSLQSTPSQPPAEDRWAPPSADCGAAHALTLCYDGMTLLSGHQNGKVLSWTVGRKKYASTVADYTHPVTNLFMLPPNGLPHPSLDLKRVAHTIIKPRYDSSLSETSQAAGAVPADYTFSTHLLPSISSKSDCAKPDQFTEAFSHAYFPESMLEEGLAELAAFSQPTSNGAPVSSIAQGISDEDLAAKDSQISQLEEELATLKKKSSVNETARQSTTDEVTKLRSDLANLHDYINELHEKQEQAQREKILRQARKEERETRRREAWFAAEKKGKKGDAVLRKMDAEDTVMTSDTDDQSSDE
ncbi:pre-rRNA-processing protein crb3/ipi3 [Aspergillus awamori]|uniref:Pre-rRNA-processing protein IPI3 n=1 Tax=Aspergillus awamori TaxID=105351 RepID=A0A401KNL8_ASPAW|nr:pre-rRNA-processing protein crb3/ipi3 [Aspergillus awamori]GKZ55500.1 pre-rRNA-processing protein ipi3 [Aspergillus niger]GKZ71628.1 pre-rRNA-processing protein ipi3 [Aspergillus niger]GKZ81044.1 pre-rRNA-processing protein ipi3 [Aspergillus niger]GLA03337.1 pre-rRNA-processing protein ipi3 [Aspergillus niger]